MWTIKLQLLNSVIVARKPPESTHKQMSVCVPGKRHLLEQVSGCVWPVIIVCRPLHWIWDSYTPITGEWRVSAGSGKPFWHLRIPKVKCRVLENIFGVNIVGKSVEIQICGCSVWSYFILRGAPWSMEIVAPIFQMTDGNSERLSNQCSKSQNKHWGQILNSGLTGL